MQGGSDHAGATGFFLLLRQHSYLFVGDADRDAGVSVAYRHSLAAIQPSTNSDRTEQHVVRKEPSSLELQLAGYRAAAARLGIPFAGPAPYPADPDLLALRVGALAAVEGWCPEYSKATFRAWFLERKASGLPDNVAAVLAGLGKPSRETMSRATRHAIDARLEAETDAARQLGIFGSPTFVVGTELFWGDDRLEDALAYASPAA
jgi:2-hydroxychromene-2-carboxylate isomerase